MGVFSRARDRLRCPEIALEKTSVALVKVTQKKDALFDDAIRLILNMGRNFSKEFFYRGDFKDTVATCA